MAASAAVVALVAIGLIGWSLSRLSAATDGIEITRTHWDSMPVTLFAPRNLAAASDRLDPERPEAIVRRPAVVLAHGFAGSQQLMQPFAVTLARNGFLAVTFDFPGHGRHPTPLPGSLRDHEALLAALLGAIDRAVTGARSLPAADGRVALVGHSMASDLVVRHAQTDPGISATVGVSLVYGGAEMKAPRNLLSIYGSLEPDMVQSFGRRLVADADTPGAADAVRAGVTYGRFEDGSARRLVLAGGAEHIGVLYHATSLRESLDWISQAFGRAGSAEDSARFIDARGRAIGALLLGIVALAWPLSIALRWTLHNARPATVRAELFGRDPRPMRTRDWLTVTLLPAVATPLVLRVLPTSFLPILLGDYLLLHFALYGVLTAAGIGWLVRRRVIELSAPRPPSAAALLAIVVVLLWCTLAIGLPVDRYLFNLRPADGRGVLILAMLAGTLAWFGTDEWLTRHRQAPRWAYPFTKACFIVSLTIAVSLDLSRLFFLIIIIPAILAMFVVYGLFSRWSFRATGSPWPAALASACAFAWGIAVTFPEISR